ncbi:MAG: PAS domain S-box protein [Mariprofundaceae bacterium]
MIKLTHNSTIWLGGSLGIALTIAVAISTIQYINQTAIQQFLEQARHVQQQVSNQLDQAKGDLNHISTAFYINPERNQSQLINNNNHVTLYAPIIKHPHRLEFEREQQEDGYITYHIHDGDQTAAIHPAYLPITHIDPFTVQQAQLLGLDLLNRSETRKAILRATRTGKLAVSMLQLGQPQAEAWLIQPIYSGLAGPKDPYFTSHQMEMLNGIAALKLPLKELLNRASSNLFIHTELSLTQNANPKGFNWQLSSSGLELTKDATFAMDSKHQLLLSMQQILPWSQQQIWLVFIITLIGLGITFILIRTSLSIIRSEQYKDNILQSAFEGILSFDKHGSIIEMNPAAQEVFQLMKLNPELPVQKNFDFPHINPNQHLDQQLLDPTIALLNQPIELSSSDSSACIIECSITSLSASTEPHFTMFFRDISRRKSNEAELAKLATIVAQSFNAIIVTDCQGKITYVNHAFEKISGFSSSYAIGKNPNIVKSAHHPDSYYQEMWAQLTAGKSWSGNFINLAKDGRVYEVEQTISPIFSKPNQQHVGYTAIQQDITERKHLQKQDEHAQRLESLGVLAGGIAHDFNNLLTAIMGNASLAKQAAKQPERYQKYLDNITHASESAANLCTQMLAYSGKGKFFIRPINLSEMIQKTMQLLESSVSKRIQLNIDLDPKLPFIDADIAQMQQIIMNLILNAAEAIGDHNGHINITTATASLRQEDLLKLLNGKDMQAGQYIALHVEDNGCGMSSEIQKKIFDPFFTTKFTGRGLGMSAILGIVHGHHGGLQLDSEPQKGSQFSIYIPLGQHQELPVKEPKPSITKTLQPAGILIVDDEPDIRELAQCIFEDEGMRTYLAIDGEHGLSLLKQHLDDIDLILLDMTMPVLGGHEFYQLMQEFAPHIAVIIASGYSEEDIRKRFQQSLEASNPKSLTFLQKPYLPEKLIQTAQKMLTDTRTNDDS